MCPFIVLPAMMPTTGMSASPVGGTVRVASTTTTTGSRPASIATVAHGQAARASTRRTVVTTAIENIRTSRRTESASERTTVVMTSAATPSWPIARAIARTGDEGRGSRPTTYMTTVTTSSRTTARATGSPGSIVTGPT